jgi:hypothetical protein
MTVQELIEKLREYPRSATVVLGGQPEDYVFVETYDVYEKRAYRHYTEPHKFVTESLGDTVVVIA